jgi:O-antigen ligase
MVIHRNKDVVCFSAARGASLGEVIILAVLLFCLPLFEAPKNIFSGFILLFFLGRGLFLRSFGQPAPNEWAIWVLLAVTLIAPLTSEYADHVGVFASSQHWLLLGLTAIVAGRLSYCQGQWRVLIAAAIIGGIAAVGESFWIWSLNGKEYPEFRSVGHVNHSALYMVGVLAASFACLRDSQRWMWALGVMGIAASFAYFIPSKSMVAMGAGLVVSAVGLAMILRQFMSRAAILGSVVAVAVAFVGMMATPPAQGFRSELMARFNAESLLSYRENILFMALEVYDRNPVFGTGVRTFNLATDEAVVRAELEAEGRDFDSEASRFYFKPGHGHNLWTTLLVERGIVGVLAVTAYLILGFISFLRLYRREGLDDPDRQAAAFLGLLVVIYLAVAGLGNTTMIVEHGHAAMLLVAIAWGGAMRRVSASPILGRLSS